MESLLFANDFVFGKTAVAIILVRRQFTKSKWNVHLGVELLKNLMQEVCYYA